MFTGCLPAAPELGLGLRFGVGFGDGFGEGFGVVVLDFAGVVEVGFKGVLGLGVRGVLGVGGSLLIKWHGRVTFFELSAGDDWCATDRRAATGMRLGESCARRGEDARRFLDGPGVVGVAGTDGQSSDRLSSHGSLPIFSCRLGSFLL